MNGTDLERRIVSDVGFKDVEVLVLFGKGEELFGLLRVADEYEQRVFGVGEEDFDEAEL